MMISRITKATHWFRCNSPDCKNIATFIRYAQTANILLCDEHKSQFVYQSALDNMLVEYTYDVELMVIDELPELESNETDTN